MKLNYVVFHKDLESGEVKCSGVFMKEIRAEAYLNKAVEKHPKDLFWIEGVELEPRI